MNFSAAFSELFILSYLVWNFPLQLSLLSDFHLPSLWCRILCSYLKCSSLTQFTKLSNTLLRPCNLSQLRAFLKWLPYFALPTLKQGIWGLVDIRAWVSICCEKCAVSDLSTLSSAHCHQLSFKSVLISFARNCKSWKVKSAGDLLSLQWTQNKFFLHLTLLFKEPTLVIQTASIYYPLDCLS